MERSETASVGGGSGVDRALSSRERGGAAHRYDLLAVDLDGTLLNPEHEVSAGNVEAVRRAREAGIEVVICTGRGFAESGVAVEAIGAGERAAGRDVAPFIACGGAMVVDASTGSTMHRWAMDGGLVEELCALFASFGRAPLLLKDRDRAGYDYLVVETGPIEPPTEWWFEAMPVTVRSTASLSVNEGLVDDVVRVGFAASLGVMEQMARAVRERFGERAQLHSYPAVTSPEVLRLAGLDEEIHLLEVFDRQVSKWTAVHRLALEQGIPRERVAAIGDQVNDLAMIEGAGLGIAMANAVPAVMAAADRRSLDNRSDGVAHAIEQILRGAW